MEHEEINNLKTICCGANYIQPMRYKWICDKCKEDRSVEFIMMIDSQEKADRLEQWRQTAINSKEAMEAKKKLGMV